jgi:hypothetical protein
VSTSPSSRLSGRVRARVLRAPFLCVPARPAPTPAPSSRRKNRAAATTPATKILSSRPACCCAPLPPSPKPPRTPFFFSRVPPLVRMGRPFSPRPRARYVLSTPDAPHAAAPCFLLSLAAARRDSGEKERQGRSCARAAAALALPTYTPHPTTPPPLSYLLSKRPPPSCLPLLPHQQQCRRIPIILCLSPPPPFPTTAQPRAAPPPRDSPAPSFPPQAPARTYATTHAHGQVFFWFPKTLLGRT